MIRIGLRDDEQDFLTVGQGPVGIVRNPKFRHDGGAVRLSCIIDKQAPVVSKLRVKG